LSSLSYVAGLLLLLIYTVVTFAALNYALSKLDTTQFVYTVGDDFFLFFYYSFRTFIFGGIPEITPVKLYSQALSMSEQWFAIMLLFILLSLFFSIRNDKYRDELEKTISGAENLGRSLEGLIHDTYRMTLEEAMEEIGKMQGNLSEVIIWLSKNME
jgi:hypothetical protein